VEVKTWFEAQGKIAARRDFAMTSVGNGGSVETPVVGLYKLESSGPIACLVLLAVRLVQRVSRLGALAPVCPTLLNLSSEELVSKFAFKRNSHRYGLGVATSQWVAFNIEKRKMARIPAAVLDEFKVGRCTLNSTDPPPPRLIGCNMCRPMRRLNAVCVSQ
jgi:hypothetical protein